MDGTVAMRQTKFTRTCSLLRQYIREKGGGSAAGRLLGTVPTTTHDHTPNKPPAGPGPCPSVFLPDLNGSATGQMTIFYGGKVLVFDDFPAHKAKQLMDAVTVKGGLEFDPVPKVTMTITRTTAPGSIHHPTTEGGDPLPSGRAYGPSPTPHDELLVPGSDLPIARRVSLNRFLEKRKDRIISKAPYQLVEIEFDHAASSAAAAALERTEKIRPLVRSEEEDREVLPSWLGLAPPSDPTGPEMQ